MDVWLLRAIVLSFVQASAAKGDADLRDYRKLCDDGVAYACSRLGDFYLDGISVPRSPQKAVELYRRACDAQVAEGCFSLAGQYEKGIGTARDVVRALETYRKACALVDVATQVRCGTINQACLQDGPARCVVVGLIYRDGFERRDSYTITRDAQEAVEAFGKGCVGGVPEGCFYFADMLKTESSHADEVNEAFRNACDGGVARACFEFADRYYRGFGVAENKTIAVTFYAKACEGGSWEACVALGTCYMLGQGVAVDADRGVDLIKTACEKGLAEGCANLATAYQVGGGVQVDPPKAFQFSQRACDLGSSRGCFSLAVAYVDGRLAPRDRGRAMDLFRKACDLGDAEACSRAQGVVMRIAAIVTGVWIAILTTVELAVKRSALAWTYASLSKRIAGVILLSVGSMVVFANATSTTVLALTGRRLEGTALVGVGMFLLLAWLGSKLVANRLLVTGMTCALIAVSAFGSSIGLARLTETATTDKSKQLFTTARMVHSGFGGVTGILGAILVVGAILPRRTKW